MAAPLDLEDGHAVATSLADAEARLRRLVTDLERWYPSAIAYLAESIEAFMAAVL